MSHHFETLKAAVIEASEANTWGAARSEWQPSVIWDNPGGTCTCGYNPITQHNLIVNTHNDNKLWVGRICIKQFFELPEVEQLWAAIDRLKADPTGCIPLVLVDAGHKAGVLREHEHRFLSDIYRKRNLSPKQQKWRTALAARILGHIKQEPQ